MSYGIFNEEKDRVDSTGLLRACYREKYLVVMELPKNKTRIGEETLKSQYKKLARIHHPDKGGNVSWFQELNRAYTELSKNEKIYQDIDEKRKAEVRAFSKCDDMFKKFLSKKNAKKPGSMTENIIMKRKSPKPKPFVPQKNEKKTPRKEPVKTWSPSFVKNSKYILNPIELVLEASLSDIYNGSVEFQDWEKLTQKEWDRLNNVWSVSFELKFPCIDCRESICTLHKRNTPGNPCEYSVKMREVVKYLPGSLDGDKMYLQFKIPFNIWSALTENNSQVNMCENIQRDKEKINQHILRYFSDQTAKGNEDTIQCDPYYFVRVNVTLVEKKPKQYYHLFQNNGYYHKFLRKPVDPVKRRLYQSKEMSSEQMNIYNRTNADLFYKMNITMEQALTSSCFLIPHINGKEYIELDPEPHCIPMKYKLTLSGNGMPILKSFDQRDDKQEFGDLIVIINVQYPNFFICPDQEQRNTLLGLLSKSLSYDNDCIDPETDKKVSSDNEIFNVTIVDKHKEDAQFNKECEKKDLAEEKENDDHVGKKRKSPYSDQDKDENNDNSSRPVYRTRSYYKRTGKHANHVYMD